MALVDVFCNISFTKLKVVYTNIAHRLPVKDFLRLKEALLHLVVEQKGFVAVKKEKVEVLKTERFHFHHLLDHLFE